MLFTGSAFTEANEFNVLAAFDALLAGVAGKRARLDWLRLKARPGLSYLRMKPRPCRATHRAFTLIELLTVIAIIGILAAIIIPVVGKVRSSARNAQCLSNLRQIGSALQSFANDNRNLWPAWDEQTNYAAAYAGTGVTAARWQAAALAPYVGAQPSNVTSGTWPQAMLDGGTIFRCPSSDASNSTIGTAYMLGYAYNVMLPPGSRTAFNTTQRVTPARLDSPSRTLVVVDSGNHRVDGDRMGDVIAAGNARHGGKVNALFGDGHVSSFGITDPDETNTWSARDEVRIRWTGR